MSVFHVRRALVGSAITLIVAGVMATSGCGISTSSAGSDSNSNEITVWSQLAGNDGELKVLKQAIKDYNASSSKKATVKLQTFPSTSYNTSVTSAASGGTLPCVVAVDEPNIPNWAWSGILTPLTDAKLLARTKDLLPSTVGKYNGKTYGLGNYDATVGLFARKSVLKKLGIRIATVDDPWSQSELEDALAKMKASNQWTYPFEMGTKDTTSEWYSYGFSPILQSFGGDLINRSDYQSADGSLNGAAAVKFAKWMRNLVTKGYTSSKGASDTALAFANNKVGLLYGGMWSWSSFNQYAKDKDDIVSMPMADFGKGLISPGGSWETALTKTCNNKAAAQDYIRFSLQDKYMAAASKAGMNIPASEGARKLVPEFDKGGSMEVFVEISKKKVVMRPLTPAYSYIQSQFATSLSDILNGADAQSTLDKLTSSIDSNIKTNNGYKA
ncbi:MAG: sugar ABC transporter substrate-binding protein [Bifidobacterium aquikefiri]|uniref:Sugar-binding protein n=1 Tax=Bifidobacterium aquikefiri TaxID=1653207 RepID=A0A261G894_9BIFI|nr:sugar ABC transporter substrate-binding protein [Bifidobacterium aquikefiri]OZG67226.1 sugar-binding protein [Bifidobacterium aquikefiri]